MHVTRITWVISLLICFLSVSLTGQDAGDENWGFEFPDVKGWVRSEAKFFEREELGYSVHYESAIGGTVSIYVYDMGMSKIPDGTESELVRREIENAHTGVKQMVSMGYNGYEKQTVIESGSAMLGGESGKLRALRKLLKLTISGRDYTSEIFVFGYDNSFVKIRSTRVEEIEGLKNKAVAELLESLDEFFYSRPTKSVDREAPVGDK